MIRLVTVGTGTVSPHAERTSAAHWVELDGQMGRRAEGQEDGIPPDPQGGHTARLPPPVRLLMDCGAGTCHRLQQLGLPWLDLTHIAITHFHADHFGELPALLFAMKYGARQPRSAPLTLIGPVGFGALLGKLASAYGDWVTAPGWPLTVTEITPGNPVGLGPQVVCDCLHVPHTDESLALSVATPGGRLVYTGDTGPSDELGDWARGCDLLLAECSLPDTMAMAIHLTPSGAAALAARAEAKRLVLTHLYPPVEVTDILGVVSSVYRGPAVVARDGDRFEVGAIG